MSFVLVIEDWRYLTYEMSLWEEVWRVNVSRGVRIEDDLRGETRA